MSKGEDLAKEMIERELCGRVGSAIHVQDGRQGRKRRCRLERIRQFASYQRRRRIKTTRICRSILLFVKSVHAHSKFRPRFSKMVPFITTTNLSRLRGLTFGIVTFLILTKDAWGGWPSSVSDDTYF
jgi:hypothetical protein